MDDGVTHAQPTWFGPDTAPLFGVVHTPKSEQARGGVIICPPLGKEHVDTYRGLKLLAQDLSARGFLVLRFDYLGTGDSAGPLGTDSAVQDYQDSIRTAAEYLRSSGVTQVGVVGLRMGALLAATARGRLDALVLWDPVLDGRRYLREQRALYKIAVGDDVIHVDGEAILGTSFSPEGARQLKALRLPESGDRAAPTLIVCRQEWADEPKIQALATAPERELVTVTGQSEYVQPATFVVEIPLPTLKLITDWLDRSMPAAEKPVRPVIRRTAQVAQLPDGRAILETFDELGPNHLFGIRSAASDAAPGTSTLLIHNTASEHRVGAGRVWTRTCREIAAHGLAAVRYDRRGTGDTGWATTDFAMIYSSESMIDVRDAMAATGVPGDRLMMAGICSGSWNSAMGAIRYGARAVVLVNAILFGTRHDAVGPEKLVGMTPPSPVGSPAPEPRTWKAIAKKAIRRWLPYPLWLLMGRLGLTEVPEVLLRALHDHGVAVDMVLSPEDNVWFDKQRGQHGLARLAKLGWSPSITLAPTGDHSLQQRDIQHVASERILEVARREFADLLAQSSDGNSGPVIKRVCCDPPAPHARYLRDEK